MSSFAVIQIRSGIKSKAGVRDTLKMLRLGRVNHVVIVRDDPATKGMLHKVKDYVTWGELKPEVLAKLIHLRGRLQGNVPVNDKYMKDNTEHTSVLAFAKSVCKGETKYGDLKAVKPLFRMNPPIGGYVSVKKSFRNGGDLGYRGAEINALIDKMLKSDIPKPPKKKDKPKAAGKGGAKKGAKAKPAAAKKETKAKPAAPKKAPAKKKPKEA